MIIQWLQWWGRRNWTLVLLARENMQCHWATRLLTILEIYFALTLKFLFKIFIFQSFTFQSIFKMLKGYTPGSLKSLLTSRVFTAKSRAALVSDGPYCKKKKKKKNQYFVILSYGYNQLECFISLVHNMKVKSKSTSSGGTRFATFRIINASPGWNPRMVEGHTLESAQAITMNCSWICQFNISIQSYS